ncbi:MAG TPA: His/Gly/Thr/Pro-type tRNA ligase C-terminal domain-containing protein [Candidatus Paceibacterota bacterium]
MSQTDFLKRASSVASYYGFMPLEIALEKYSATGNYKKTEPVVQKSHDCFSEEMSTLVEHSLTLNVARMNRPLQLYHVRTESGKSARNSGKARIRFGLTVFGIEQSIAEALILSSALAILNEVGVKEASVHINSVGDRDSMQRFTRELNTYFRKNLAIMPATCREALKRDILDAHEFLLERKHPLLEGAPQPMQFLSDAHRRHLKEVLEFLESSEIPYEIDGELTGARDYYSQTMFEIKETGGDDAENVVPVTHIARGGRCDDLFKRFHKAHVPTVSIIIEKLLETARVPAWKPPRVRRPRIYFVQLGSRAKLLSLSVTEALRKAHIPLQQAIGSNSLTEQLEEARSLSIPRAIIMGQREALDGTVIVRDLNTHAQTVLPVGDLSEYLKSSMIL